jgi:NSS family neurotransmitter:Na+ symporter
MAPTEETTNSWSSRPAFLLAAIGGAVGLGNLWRFPYIAGEYGGGGFVLIYLGFVLLLGVPLMAGEMMLGRRGHRSPVNAIAELVRAENANIFWRSIGWMSLLVPFIGLSYYAVVAAWAIDYLALAANNAFSGFDAATSQNTFAMRIDRPIYQAALHGLFVALTVWVVARGVNKGIEQASKILMPALFGVIIVIVIYGIVSADFAAAARFLFNPDFSAVTGESFLVALGQALFSLGIGVGLMITYASYMPRNYSLRASATIVCVGDTVAAILAGFAIFPIVFASGLDPAEGPGLIFVTLPIAFGNMAGGHIIGTLFFILLLFAAYTSAIGMLEPVVAWLEECNPGRRKKMAVMAGAAVWIFGLGSVFSFSFMADFRPLAFLGIEKNFFGIADYTVATVLAPINALLIALFAGWVVRRVVVDEEFGVGNAGWKAYWRVANRYLAPTALIIVLIDLVIGWKQILQAF